MDRAVLSDANFAGANLTGANLSRVNLTGANLTDAVLTGANLSGATLTRTNLTNATLEGADFYESTFHSADFTGAKFSGSIMGYTVIQRCDFSPAEGLDQIRHDAPSTIGVDTLYLSGGNISEEFLLGAGVPESLLEFQRSLIGAPIARDDCFISCSSKDHGFARDLQRDLRARGIRCWLFPEDARGNALVDRKSNVGPSRGGAVGEGLR